jgi:hypothetical protein
MIAGIDLGTTNSLVALWRNGQAELVPNALGDVLTPWAVSIERCSNGILPARCQDRTELDALLGVSRRVRGEAYRYYFIDRNAIQLQLPDGRTFGVAAGFNCDAAWEFAGHGTWLRQGDAKAAYQFVADLATCPPPTGESRLLLRTLLLHTDAWPAEKERSGRRLANLGVMVSPPVEPPVLLAPAQPPKPTLSCFSNPTETELSGIGPMEAKAIKQSAVTR